MTVVVAAVAVVTAIRMLVAVLNFRLFNYLIVD